MRAMAVAGLAVALGAAPARALDLDAVKVRGTMRVIVAADGIHRGGDAHA